jgi:nitrogenase molybdenum-cofactor synthesis protein NifE
LSERKDQIFEKGAGSSPSASAATNRAWPARLASGPALFCGSRVVLYPIADALHLMHGPIGCASYTWDIRGALSSGPPLHRYSFSTDLGETDVIFGGEKKLTRALDELIPRHRPKAAFVYSTCMVGLIGDDLQAVCKKAEAKATASR